MNKLIGNLIEYLKNNPHSRLSYLAAYVYSLLGNNRIKGKCKNIIRKKNAYLKNVKITIIGENNVIDLEGGANYLMNCTVYICGSNNIITLGKRNVFWDCDLYVEDDANLILFGDSNRIMGRTHVACCEGTKVTFGNGSLFSTDVTFRTTDSHSILDLQGNRINPAKSIVVKDRCWFGNKTVILKGVEIESDSIIGTGSIVTKNIPANSIAAGNPARVVRSGINWDINRI